MSSTRRSILNTRRWRSGRAVATAVAFVLLAGAFSATNAFATHAVVTLTGSNFEIDTDANLKVDDAAPAIDWASVNQIRKADTPSGQNDESFGQGTKEDTAAPTVVKGSIPPNKSDLKEFGVYQEGNAGGSGFLNMYWSRVQEPVGTTNMDFEFNHRQCTPGQTPADPDCTANGITPFRTTGDLLITYDLSQGGTHPTLSVREWTGSAWGAATDLTASLKATGSINSSAIPVGESDGIGAQSARTFGEAQLNLSAIFDSSSCQSFGSVYLKSRASDSFTAALKDFVPPAAVNITNCGSVTVNKSDDLGALAGAGFTLYKDASPVGGSVGAEDTVAAGSCTTSASGTCSISDVFFGQYWLVETTVPASHTGVDPQHVSVTGTTPVVFNLNDPRVILQPTISTAQRFVPNDSASIAVDPGQGNLAGDVVFNLYLNADCSGNAQYTSANIPVSGSLTQTVSSSNTVAYTTNTTYSWKVTYTSTNTGHHDVVSNCTEHSSITVNNG
ncbi:MAG: hypothetical protein QOH48_2480 [Actinomycetota bacterium]|nr:hypothetical protein [Actinomycetota bacterium]